MRPDRTHDFCRSLQRLVPAVEPDGRLVDDFHFVKGERNLHVVNAQAPAATASLAIGQRIVAEAAWMRG